MKQDEDISILITDKKFQSILSGWTGFDEEKKSQISKEYELTIEEVNTLQKLWLGLDFHTQEISAVEVESALNETLWSIAERKTALAEKTSIRKLYEQFAKIAAILLIPLMLYTVYIQFSNNKPSTYTTDQQLITVNTQAGTTTKLVLPDGTKVCLNAGSSISYPNSFAKKERNVSLSGEAYFEVVKNKEVPMIISSGTINLKVYGTSFNVNAYPDEESAKVTLIDGVVSLSSLHAKFNGKEEFFIKPGQTVTYHANSKKLDIDDKDTFIHTAWKDGLLVFKNVSFESVLKQLSRRFNVEIELTDQTLASIPMDATFRNENINEILRLLSLGTPFKYSYSPQLKLSDGTFKKSKIYIESK